VTRSPWAADIPRFPPLGGDLESDVCIVGAGIAGLTTALLLARDGRSVVVVDDGPVAGGETARTTAHLASVIDDGFQEIERLHGERGVRLAYQSHGVAIDAIERIVHDESIDCSFRRLDGYLFLAGGRDESFLDAELAAAHRAGCSHAQRLPRLEVGIRSLGPCIRFPNQGQIHPLRYCAGLARAATARGARIFEAAHANAVEAKDGRAFVHLAAGPTVSASHVVVASNTPFNDRFAIHTKQAAYRTYAIAAPIARGSVPIALYWDTEDPYHYVRVHDGEGDGELLIIGGEDHKTGQADDNEARFARLETWAHERFPAMEAVTHHWSGQVIEPVDGIAYIGRNPLDEPNVYIATGDSGMGMTHGTIAAILIRDLIGGRDNQWAALYDPSRKTLRAATEWLSENLNVAREITSLATPGEVSTVEEIPRGAGAVIRRGIAKVAAYRDHAGALHERSAICPHLGCVVAWNAVEKSWDCPCHGSRFDALGRVVNGPSASDLSPLE
jgi:glycine/D-amino acid oxidase-like deaminating enzyme/nitrite reductase/ring-hydroxylating ferredoxin subunit